MAEKQKKEDPIITELKSLKRGIYYLVGVLSEKKGSSEEYLRLNNNGFSYEEIGLMFGVSESAVQSGISQLRLRKGTRKKKPDKEKKDSPN